MTPEPVENEDSLLPDADARPNGPKAVVELSLDRPFNPPDGGGQEAFCRQLRERLSLAQAPRALSRPSGCVGVALELPAGDGERLFRGFMEGRLNDLNVVGAR